MGGSGQSGFLIGQNVYRLAREVTVISYSPLSYAIIRTPKTAPKRYTTRKLTINYFRMNFEQYY
jgi:hypothetical protein